MKLRKVLEHRVFETKEHAVDGVLASVSVQQMRIRLKRGDYKILKMNHDVAFVYLSEASKVVKC